MRRTTLSLACLLVATAASTAHADGSPQVWAKRDTQLHSRPGEASSSIGKVQSGERLVVIGSQGRWLRVRHRQRTGWVTRTQVEERGDRAARKRRNATGFSGKQREDALKVVVDIDKVRAFDDPRTKAKEVLDLKRGDQLVVLGRGHEGWILVELDGAGVGWIPESAVTDGGRFTGDPRRAPSETGAESKAEPARVAKADKAEKADKADKADTKADDDDEADEADEADAAPVRVATVEEVTEDRPAPTKASATATAARPVGGSKIAVSGGIGLGLDTYGMRQSGFEDALATSYSPAVAVAVDGHYRITDTIWVGAAIDAEMSSGTITFTTATEEVAGIAAQHMSVNGRAEVTYAPSWRVAGRLGWHYGSLAVESDRDDAILLGETFAGPTVGLGGGLPIGRRFAVMGAVDVAPFLTQAPSEQPDGFLYGTSMQAAWASLMGTMQLPWRLTGALAYRAGLTSLDLTDGAATNASRTDQTHTITAGVRLAW
jgi:hypothetical protein